MKSKACFEIKIKMWQSKKTLDSEWENINDPALNAEITRCYISNNTCNGFHHGVMDYMGKRVRHTQSQKLLQDLKIEYEPLILAIQHYQDITPILSIITKEELLHKTQISIFKRDALCIAVRMDVNINIIKTIIDKARELNILKEMLDNNEGMGNPLECAFENGNRKVIKLLFDAGATLHENYMNNSDNHMYYIKLLQEKLKNVTNFNTTFRDAIAQNYTHIKSIPPEILAKIGDEL